jgi:hypothetical protein
LTHPTLLDLEFASSEIAHFVDFAVSFSFSRLFFIIMGLLVQAPSWSLFVVAILSHMLFFLQQNHNVFLSQQCAKMEHEMTCALVAKEKTTAYLLHNLKQVTAKMQEYRRMVFVAQGIALFSSLLSGCVGGGAAHFSLFSILFCGSCALVFLSFYEFRAVDGQSAAFCGVAALCFVLFCLAALTLTGFGCFCGRKKAL